MQPDVADRSENFLVDTGATYSVLTSYTRAFFSQTCTIWGATGKTITKKIHFSTLLLGWTNIFHISFWWSPNVLLPYWKEIFPCLRSLAGISVLIGDTLKLSLGGKLTIFASHQVKQLLNGRDHLWMTDQSILR